MLGEEYMLIAGSSSNLAAPAAPTVTKRTAGSNETTVGTNTYYKVFVTATNFFGETVASSVGDASGTTSGQVVDVTIVPVQGAMNYNIYVSTRVVRFDGERVPGGAGCRRHEVTRCRAPRRSVARPRRRRTRARVRRPGSRVSSPPCPACPRRRGSTRPSPTIWHGGLLQQRRRHPPVLQRDLHGAEEPVAVDVEQPGLVPGRPGGDHLLAVSTSRTCPTT